MAGPVTATPSAAEHEADPMHVELSGSGGGTGGVNLVLVEVPKVVTEYPMPGAMQTHEMAVVGENLLVVSQQTNSSLVKVQLDPGTGRPLSCTKSTVGTPWSGLHGLTASREYHGHVWATLQFDNTLVRLDVNSKKVRVVQNIPLPASVAGPHCVLEDGPDIWTTCKDSGHVVRVSHRNPSEEPSVFACSPKPIFVAIHPTSCDVYASLAGPSSKIWRLVRSTGKTSEKDIPKDKGSQPVGLIAGPDKNLWFVLLGDASGGTGTFGRINEDGKITWFHLTTPAGANPGLIHLAFDWDYHATKPPDSCSYRMWLLASSGVSNRVGADAVFTVQLVDDDDHDDDDDDGGKTRIVSQHTITLPTPTCFSHRILPHRTGLFVTELRVSTLAYVSGAAALNPSNHVVANETADVYMAFGLGIPSPVYTFTKQAASRSLAAAPASQMAAVTTNKRRREL